MTPTSVASRWRSVLIGLVVGGAFVAYVVQRGDWREIWRTASAADRYHVLGVSAATLGFLAVKALRWRILLTRATHFRPGRLFASIALGSAANYGVPHAGELLRAAMARRDTGLPLGTVLASIVAERVLDLVAIAVAAITLGLVFPDNTRFVDASRVIGLGGAVLLLGILLVLTRPQQVLHWFDFATSVLPARLALRLSQAARNGMVGLDALRDGRTLSTALLLSAAQWTFMAGGIAFALHSVGVPATVAATTATLVFSVVGLTLPSAPGYAGTTQIAFLWALTPLGVDETSSLAASVVYNALVVVTVLVIAACSSWRSRHPAYA